jgi:hypothetical protein
MEDDVADITKLLSLCFKLFKVMVKILDFTLTATKLRRMKFQPIYELGIKRLEC